MKRMLAALALSTALALALVPGLAFAAENGSGPSVGKAPIATQESAWGWVSVEGGPTFYGVPQTIKAKGLTMNYKNANSSYNKARFILYKGDEILYTEDVKFTRSDWYGQVPVEWSCEVTELGEYTLKFFHIYDQGSGYQRVGDIYEAPFVVVKPLEANPMTVKAKTIKLKASKLKAKSCSVKASKAFTVKKAKGQVTYKVAKYVTKAAKGKVKVAKSGKVTVKKGLKKGTYKLKVKVTAAGDSAYKAKSKTVTLTVKVS